MLNKNFLKNKKGDQYLTPWLFFILFIIGVGIAAGVYLFFSNVLEVKAEEADVFSIRLADCFIEDNYLNENINAGNVFDECGLNKEVIEGEDIFYFKVEVRDLNSGELVGKIQKGVVDFEKQCEYSSGESHLAKCSKNIIYASSESDVEKKYVVEIVAASNQRGNLL